MTQKEKILKWIEIRNKTTKDLMQYDNEIVKEVFNDTYPKDYSKEVFARLERDGKLDALIEKHYPHLVYDGLLGKETAKFTMIKQLGWDK
jgi:hypothetical protein